MNEPLGPCRILRCGGIELPEETQSHARKTRPPPPCYQPTALLFVTFFFFFFFPFSTKPPNSTRSLASPSKLTTLYPRRVCILSNMLLSFISLFSLSLPLPLSLSFSTFHGAGFSNQACNRVTTRRLPTLHPGSER